MSRVRKILLSLGLLLVLAGTGAGIWWWQNGDEFLAGLRSRGKARLEEGRRLGSKSTPMACVQDGTARAGACGSADLFCEIDARVFMEGCLSATDALPQFCEGLPAHDEILARAAWAVDFCAQLGRPDERCARMVNGTSALCARRAGVAG